MSIHYKFKNALNVDTVTFDGLHISVSDLKKSIIQQKQLGNTADFDLRISNAQTKEDYIDDAHLIPKNTSLIIARIPLAHVSKKSWDQHASQQSQPKGLPRVDKKVILDLSKMNGSEEDKIQAMMVQSSADYDPKGYQRIRGQNQTGDVPTSYRCNKCKKGGHWIKNCPFSGKDHIEVKRTTGIPKSFREKDEQPSSPQKNAAEVATAEKCETIPEDLICSICKDIFTDAVMIPCCGSSFCDDCVRTSLLESEDNECPDCKEKGSSPGSLIPNRFLRNSVNTFKNETGYKQAEKKRKVPVPKPVVTPVANEEPVAEEQPTKTESAKVEEETTTETTKTEAAAIERENGSDENTEAPTTAPPDMESDYEDNIVVTVPSTQRETPSQAFKIKSHDVKHSRNLMPPGLEHPIPAPAPRGYRLHSPKSDEMRRDRDAEIMQSGPSKHITSHMHSSNPMHVMPRDMLPGGPGGRHDMYPRHPYPQMPYHGQAVRGPPMGYNRMPHAPPAYSHFPQPPYNTHSGYILTENSGARPVMPSINLASVYQGVAAKVGSGVIDDPLEAFNRIMREKEREREREHQRSPNRRRSNSTDKNMRGRLSPQLLRRNRIRNSPYDHKDDRMIEAKQRDRRGYSREREKIPERNRWRELRKGRRSSRSRSRSIPTSRKILTTNPIRRRYSRSKSPLAGTSRPHQSANQRPIRRNPDMRNKSPVMNHSQNRNMGRSTHYGRQKSNQEYEEEKFREQSYREHLHEIQALRERERHKIEELHKEIFDISPPGTSEPPPPGFDNTSMDLMNINQRITESEQKNLPDIYEKFVSRDFNDRKMYRRDFDPSERSSRSRSSKRSSEEIVRQSRSRTVSKERVNKPEFVVQKVPNILETNERSSYKEYEVQKPKRRRKSEEDEVKHEVAPLRTREELVDSKNHKAESSQNNGKNHASDNDFNLKESKKEPKRSDKKEEKLEKKIKERKKKKKYKEEKERKKLKKEKREKQNEKESTQLDNTFNEPEVSVTPDMDSRHKEGKLKNIQVSEIFKDDDVQEAVMINDKELNEITKSESNIEYSVSNNGNTHSNSILDIHCYEVDFDHFQHHDDVAKPTSLPFPTLSKWEREDQTASATVYNVADISSKSPDGKRNRVTDEVLRRAEHAIFSKDNNNRNHSDGKKLSSERVEKFSSSERSKPLSSMSLHRSESKDNTERVQITIPSGNRSQRSIEIMDERPSKSSLAPVIKKSVKDRLGSKVVKTNFDVQNPEIRQVLFRDHSRDRSRDQPRDRSRDFPKDRIRDHPVIDRSRDHPIIHRSRERSRERPIIGRSRDRSKDRPIIDRSRDRPIIDRSRDRSRHRSRDDPITDRSRERRRSGNNERLLNRNDRERYRKQGEKKVEKNEHASREKSISSNSSNSELESDDVKQNKKRKHKKEKKRKKRSSSTEVAEGSKKKHSKSKKKSSKKNKSKI